MATSVGSFFRPIATDMQHTLCDFFHKGKGPVLAFGEEQKLQGVLSTESKEELDDIRQKLEELGVRSYDAVYSDQFTPSYSFAFETGNTITRGQEKEIINTLHENGLAVNNLSHIDWPHPHCYKAATLSIFQELEKQNAFRDDVTRMQLSDNYKGIFYQSLGQQRPFETPKQTEDGVNWLTQPFTAGQTPEEVKAIEERIKAEQDIYNPPHFCQRLP